MNTDITKLLAAQFLTAFSDNAILFIAITMVLQVESPGSWYVPALQASFLVAFVVLGPWVGTYADTRPKAGVLVMANIIKAAGAGMMLSGIEPLIAYAVVGLGAAIYSPAKYGILPELVDDAQLVRVNGWIEGLSILAILTGAMGGAVMANRSVVAGQALVILLYGLSAVMAVWIRHRLVVSAGGEGVFRQFIGMTRNLLHIPHTRFALLGSSLFWSAATVLRILLVAWVPVALHASGTVKIAELTMYIAVGIAIGAVMASRMIPLGYLQRAGFTACLLGIFIIVLAFVHNLWLARLMLLLIGIAGGLVVVPINAAIQESGYQLVGSGHAVAVQRFCENCGMLLASGIYTLASMSGARPVAAMSILGALIVVIMMWLLYQLAVARGGHMSR